MKRILAITLAALALFAAAPALKAVKAYPYPVTVTQPDGSRLTIRIFGDENHSWKTTLDGKPVYQAGDGWWKTTDSLPTRPLLMKELNPVGGAIAPYLATKASVHVRTLVIPVQFSDLRFTVPTPRSAIYNLFNQQNYAENGATGSVLDWFRDNLGQYGNFSFEVCDVVTVPGTLASYGANIGGVTDKNVRQLVEDACYAADAAGVDFSRFDFEGDGVVDNVFLFVAGHNEAEGGGDNTLWPQSWNIADSGLELDGKKISNFSLYSEFKGPSGYQFAGIGTICHEYCHFLGLQDLYDVNDDKEGLSQGLYGTLSVMDMGNYNNEGRTPPYLTIFERQMVGLVKTQNLKQEQELTVPPVHAAGQAWLLPTGTSGEDFWLEYRDGTRWDSYIGGSGLVVYHIDRSMNSAGSMTARQRWTAGAVNACAAHPCVYFVSSQGESTTGVADAFFPGYGNVQAIHSSISFPLCGWDGRGVGLGLTGIARSADGIHVKVISDQGWDLPLVTGWSVTPYQTSALLEWQADKSGTGQWNLRWGPVSGLSTETVVANSKTSYVFEGLVPGDSYFCELFYTRWNITGKVYRIEFQALSRLSDYPLIGGADRVLHKGDSFRLYVLNLTEEKASVEWSIDGQTCRSEVFTFDHAGSYRIVATISYVDGSRETLTKILEVKDGE